MGFTHLFGVQVVEDLEKQIKVLSHVFYVPTKTQTAAGTRHIISTKMKRIAICICFSFLMTSCATVFCGSKAKVTFDCDITEKATLTIDGQKHTNVTFPYTTKIRRGFDETVVKAEAPSYSTETIVVNKNFNAVSVINLIDILGWGIDAATGAITKPEFKFYQIDFQAKETKSEKTDKQ